MDGLGSVPRAIPAAVRSLPLASGSAGAWVTLKETFRLALDALRAHKLRSFLTLLGVIMAVATLLWVMSLVSGLNFYVADKIANLGANVFVVTRFGILTSQDAFIKAQKRPLITSEDFTELKDGMRTANQVAALLFAVSDVRYGNELLEDVNIEGVTPNYSEVRSLNIHSGRFLTDA